MSETTATGAKTKVIIRRFRGRKDVFEKMINALSRQVSDIEITVKHVEFTDEVK